MRLRPGISFLTAALVAVFCLRPAHAQSVLQSGPSVGGHAPMYILGPGQGFASVMDSGFASGLSSSGTQTGAGLGELLQVNHASALGSPFGTHVSFLDNPVNTTGGYHALSFDANALGGGLITYNALGGAPPLPLQICTNGTCQTFPLSAGGTVTGPSSSTAGAVALFADTTGRALRQTPPAQITDTKTTPRTTSADTFTITSDGTTVASLIGANQQDSMLAAVYHNINATSLVQTNAIAGYTLNSNGIGSGLTGNTTALYGWGENAVANGWVWGLNTLTISKAGIGANQQISIEADVNALNTTDNLIGVQISGGSTVQPQFANALVITPVGPGNPPLPWSSGFFTLPGAVTTGIFLSPMASTGTNVNSPPMTFASLDSTGATQTFNLAAGPQSLNFFSSIANPAVQINGNMIITQGRSYQIGPDVVMYENSSHSVIFAPDTNLSTIGIGNGTTLVDINGSAFALAAFNTSALPTCNSIRRGFLYTVADASSPTYNGILAGGGASAVPVICDGTNWRTH